MDELIKVMPAQIVDNAADEVAKMIIQEKELTEKVTKHTMEMVVNSAVEKAAEEEAEKEKINDLLLQAEELAKQPNPNKKQIYELRK